MKLFLIFFGIFLVIFLTSCAEPNIVEELALVNGVSYDKTDNEELPLHVTVAYPSISVKNKNFESKVLSAYTKTSKETKMKLNFKTNLKLVSGQIRVVLFGNKLASEGVNEILDTFNRDPYIGSRIKLGIVDGVAGDLFREKLPNEADNTTFIEGLIHKLGKGGAFSSYNFYQFQRDVLDDGIDPILPMFKKKGDDISVNGLALFSDSQYKAFLAQKQLPFLFYLRRETKRGQLTIPIKNKEDIEQLLISYIRSKHKIFVNNEGNQGLTVNINVALNGSVLEYTGTQDLTKKEILTDIEKQIEDYFQDKTLTLINYLQENKVDPIGIGGIVRNSMTYEEWKNLKWKDVYSDIKINVKTTARIMDIGKSR